MIDDWSLLIDKYTVEGARSKFEEICTQLYHNIYSQENVKNVEVSKGDCGVDIFIGNLGIEPIDVIQCKFFPKFGDSQKSQITKSFKTAINSSEFEVISWTLCLINQFTIKEHQWWSKWKLGNAEYLSSDSIKLTDGLELITLLKKNNLYNIAFDKIDSLKIEELHNNFIVDKHISPEKISNTLSKSSSALQQVKNFIGNSPKAHIKRKETNDIYKWINEDLKSGTKNILVVTGEKGIGKSVILKDLYDTLKKEKVAVLGIKADKYFHSNISELEKNLFLDKITFELLIRKHSKDNKLIIIIDQIDALSYSITSNREFINTYNRLISEFQDEENIRVILSTRNYDLEYDAELSIYNSTKYKKIRVMPLLVDDVIKTLALFDISSPSQKFIELLKTPNNLNIFCSLPNKTKVNFDTISTLKDLYDELWLQLISKNKKLQNKNLIFKLADRMYDSGIAVANIYNDEFYEELTYLKSNNLIIENNKTLQFFHQTFYEYCYSKQFVENNKSLEDYLIKSEQSLYIRSVVKMVVESTRF